MKRPHARTFVPPSGDPKSNYIIVGEQPGKFEVRSRKCFIGPSGELLNSCLISAGIGRSDCYITNVIKDLDRPIQRYITLYKGTSLLKEPIISDEGQYYLDYLSWELSNLPGRYILAFGGLALFALTQRIGITRWRGSRLDCILDKNKEVFPTYHPATALPPKNQYTNRFLIINDIKQAAESKASLYVPTDRTIDIEPTYTGALSFIQYVTEQGLNGGRIAYDLEVYMDRKHKEVSCISLSHKTQAMSIPFTFGYDDYFSLKQETEIWRRLAFLLEHPKIRKCGQNLTFDGHFLLRKYGIKVRNFDDTMIAQQILMPDYPKGLDFITSIWTDHPYYKGDGKAFFKGSGAYRKFWRYNAVDSVICTEAFPKQVTEIRKQQNLETYHHQVRVVEPLVYMMEHGIKVRIDQMESEYRRMEEELFKYQGELDKVAGQHLNAKSPKQLKEYFWKQKGIKPYVYKGKATYNDDAMKRLTRRGFKEAGIIQKIRKFTKLRSTYLDIRKIDLDGRYRCSYNPVGTRYSRVSSSANIFGSGGNFQNWPHDLQRMLIPDEGYCYYAIDLGQAENRIVAYLGRVESMIEAFEQGEDVHSLTASMIFHKHPADITKVDGTCALGDGTHSERFWGKKCVVGETEVLTPAGWIRIDKWDYLHIPLAQWEHNRNITFVISDGLYVGPSETLIEFTGKNSHVKGTPDHRIPIHRSDRGIKTETTLDEIKTNIHYGIPISGYLNNSNTALNHYEVMLLVAFQADGSFNNGGLRFKFVKQRKILRLLFILNKLKLKYNVTQPRGVDISFYIGTDEVTKRIPWITKNFGSFLLMLGRYELITFVEELSKWDGYECNGRREYFTTNKNNAEWVQTLAHLSGHLATFKIRETDKSRKTLYIVKLNNRTQNANLSTHTKILHQRGDLVFGPTVPSGFFLIRSKGKISVTGNSNHGFNYDWGYKNFALKNEMPEAEGKLIYNSYHRMYPGVQQIFHADIRRHLHTSRTLVNLMGRRTTFLGALIDSTFKEAYSCIPQGTVGDIINRRGINYIYYNQEIFEPIELLRQVHDEIGFQIPLTVPWIKHAKMLRLIKAELETPLMTDYGREFVIPADISQGINLNKDDGVEYKGTLPITDLEFAQKLKQGWKKLNDRTKII